MGEVRVRFRRGVLARFDGRCCVPGCVRLAVDAHHIVDRRLFADGGYHLDNGAPLCAVHHRDAEELVVAADVLRAMCGIERLHLPDHFDRSAVYDKWGNVVHADGFRSPGELWFEPHVARITRAAGGVDGCCQPFGVRTAAALIAGGVCVADPGLRPVSVSSSGWWTTGCVPVSGVVAARLDECVAAASGMPSGWVWVGAAPSQEFWQPSWLVDEAFNVVDVEATSVFAALCGFVDPCVPLEGLSVVSRACGLVTPSERARTIVRVPVGC